MSKNEKNEYVLEIENVKKIYNPGLENEVRALQGIDLKIKKGEFVTIIGPSGSGKTTLLDILGCLLKPTSGKVIVDGIDTGKLSDKKLARIRGKKIGFIFQQYNLIGVDTALENVALALRIGGKSKTIASKKARKLLGLVGLEHRTNHRTSLLSGGECQRVAIARALANDPSIVLADEPTGNLDTKTGTMILKLLKYLNKEKGYTIVVVTHDLRIGKYSDRVIKIMDGKIV